MFWGLIVEPGKSYKQTVEKSFHVSMACLQPDKCKDTGYVSFILRTVGQEFVLCNLQKGSTNQVQLDLNFNAGDEIAFTTSGAKNTVHLSGYLITDEEIDDEMFMESDSEIDAADLRELNKKRKNLLERAGSGKIPKLEAAEDEEDDDEEAEEEEDDDDSSDDAFDTMAKLEAIDEGDEDSDDEDEDDEEEITVQPEIKTKGNKTPTAPTTPAAQTNGNGPASGKKNKKNKETPKNNANNVNSPNVQKTPKTPLSGTPSKKTLEGGVIIEDLKVGNGPQAKSGQKVNVYYTGRLKSNNKQFDANNSGKPFGFRLGRGEVIKGWDIGVCGMQLGGKRKITIPAALAYGSKGAPPTIPPNSILVFDVEMKGLH